MIQFMDKLGTWQVRLMNTSAPRPPTITNSTGPIENNSKSIVEWCLSPVIDHHSFLGTMARQHWQWNIHTSLHKDATSPIGTECLRQLHVWNVSHQNCHQEIRRSFQNKSTQSKVPEIYWWSHVANGIVWRYHHPTIWKTIIIVIRVHQSHKKRIPKITTHYVIGMRNIGHEELWWQRRRRIFMIQWERHTIKIGTDPNSRWWWRPRFIHQNHTNLKVNSL